MMGLQARLNKQDEEANEMIRSLQQTGEPEPQDEPSGQPDVSSSSEQGAEPVETPAEQPAAAEPVAAQQPTDEVSKLKSEIAQAEQRYRTLQGMMKSAQEANDGLRQMVAQMTQQVQTLLDAQKAQPKVDARLVTEKDEEAFGADLIDAMRRVAKEVAQGELAGLDGKVDGKLRDVASQVQQVGEVVAKTAAEKFDDALAQAVPDWQSVNVDPAFTEWLTPYGVKALNEAYIAGDVKATAKWFLDYKMLTGKQQPEAPAAAPSAKLESLQAPGKPKSGAQVQQGGKTFTMADWNKAFEDNRRGKLTDDQLKTFEAEFYKAQSEGRVTA